MAPKQLNVEQIDFNINYGSEHIQNVILNHEFEQTIFPIAIFSSEYTTEIDNDNTDMINAICWANAQFHSYLHRNNNLTSYNHTKTTPSHHKKQQQPNRTKFQRKMNKQKQTGKTHKISLQIKAGNSLRTAIFEVGGICDLRQSLYSQFIIKHYINYLSI